MPSLLHNVNRTIRNLQTCQKLTTRHYLNYSPDSKIDNQKTNRVYAQIQKVQLKPGALFVGKEKHFEFNVFELLQRDP